MAGDICVVTIVGRLTRDPEYRSFSGGGGVCKFGLAFTGERRKEGSEWVEKPVFLDCEAFDRKEGTGGKATVVNNYCRKGSKVFVRGHLKMDTWDDNNTGQKRSKILLTVDDVLLLDSKKDGESGGRDSRRMERQESEETWGNAGDSGGEEIPF